MSEDKLPDGWEIKEEEGLEIVVKEGEWDSVCVEGDYLVFGSYLENIKIPLEVVLFAAEREIARRGARQNGKEGQ